MPTDRVRTVLLALLLASPLAVPLAGCGGGGGNPGNPDSPVKLQNTMNGSLAVTIVGPTAGIPAAVRVSGPGNFVADLADSQTLGDIAPGAYTITALPVVAGATTWSSLPPTQTVTVSAGATATVTITYGPG